jgi:uncharacterized protein
MRFMADELRRDGTPSKVMAWMRELPSALATAGRNDPCPCGSGAKFKRCHGSAPAGH